MRKDYHKIKAASEGESKQRYKDAPERLHVFYSHMVFAAVHKLADCPNLTFRVFVIGLIEYCRIENDWRRRTVVFDRVEAFFVQRPTE